MDENPGRALPRAGFARTRRGHRRSGGAGVAFVLGVLVVACASLAPPARATEPFAKVGTYGFTFATLPRGARNIGMGGTGTADVTGFTTGYFNPAGVAWSDVVTAMGSHEEWFADISLWEVRLTSPLPFQPDSIAGDWRFGASLGYVRLDMEPITERTIFLPEGTGSTFDTSDWLLSGTAAASWGNGWMRAGVGGTAKYLVSKLVESDASTWSFDVGVVAEFPVRVSGAIVRPRFGYAVLNLDTGADYDGREAGIADERRFGVGIDVESPRIVVGGRAVPALAFAWDYDDIRRDGNSAIDYGAGAEVSVIELVHVRVGTMADRYRTLGAAVGWDFGAVGFRFDYAREYSGDEATSVRADHRDVYGGLLTVRW